MTESDPPSSPRTWDDVHWVISTVLVHAVVTGLCLWFIFRGVPHFKLIFRDFDVELPGATLLVLSLSYWVMNFWYLLLPLPIVQIFLLFYLRPRLRSLTTWLGNLYTLAAVLFGGYMTFAIFLPLVVTVQKLN
jgi:type II secretory pathway component PulF